MFNKGMNISQALEYVENEVPASTEKSEILDFTRASKKGIIKIYSKGESDED